MGLSNISSNLIILIYIFLFHYKNLSRIYAFINNNVVEILLYCIYILYLYIVFIMINHDEKVNTLFTEGNYIMHQLDIFNYHSLILWFFISFIPFFIIYKQYLSLYLNDWFIIINKL